MHLVLFFSRGITLKIWRETGLLEREMDMYVRMSPWFNTISFVTYGPDKESSYAEQYPWLKILGNSWYLPSDLFSLLSTFIYAKSLSRATLYKTNQLNGWWTAGLAKFLFHKPLIVRCGFLLARDQEKKGYKKLRIKMVRFLEKMAFQYADGIILTTKEMQREVINRYGIPKTKIGIVPNPVNTEVFKPDSGSKKVRGRIGFVGRFTFEKNIPLLFQAIKGLEQVSLLMIGDGPMRTELEMMARQLGIHVDFKGRVPNYSLPEFLNTCEAFILPSQWEGLPKALLEAMACGLPVIGSDVPGIRELIRHKETGYLCPASAQGVREAVKALLENSVLSQRLGKGGRKYIVDNYALESVIGKEIEFLKEICAEG
jgi:glycosyltransferase involved in cell wall biosynthesis